MSLTGETAEGVRSALEADPFQVCRVAKIEARRLRLSVIVPNYNTGRYIEACLRSLLQQSISCLEVVVVDDGSTDDSLERILAIQDPRLTCVRRRNGGLAAARNTGILHARSRFIGFCDSDDVWHPKKAEKHLLVMEGEPGIGVTFSHSAYLDEGGFPTGQYLVSRCTAPSARNLIIRNHVGNGSTPVVRRRCFEEAGLFNEDLGSAEDYEMWVRIAVKTRYTFRLVPEVLTGYRIRRGSLTLDVDQFVRSARLAISRVRTYCPETRASDLGRAEAEMLRIAARKSFHSGNLLQSRALLVQAFGKTPTLAVRDWRAAALTALHLVGMVSPKFARRAYGAVLGLMRILYRVAIRDSSGPGAPRRDEHFWMIGEASRDEGLRRLSRGEGC